MSEQEIFQLIETNLKTEFASFWEAEKQELQEWAGMLAKAQFDRLHGKENKRLEDYLHAGILCLKARLQFKLEDRSLAVIEKILQVLLTACLKVLL